MKMGAHFCRMARVKIKDKCKMINSRNRSPNKLFIKEDQLNNQYINKSVVSINNA